MEYKLYERRAAPNKRDFHIEAFYRVDRQSVTNVQTLYSQMKLQM